MMRLGRDQLTSLPAAWLFGAVFIVAAAKLSNAIPLKNPGGSGQDTYYVVLHDHYVVHVGLIFALFAGVYALLPRITRFGYRRGLGWLHFWLAFVGIDISLLPMLIAPHCCLPRSSDDLPRMFEILKGFALAGLLICGFAMLTFVAVLFEAFRRGTPRAE
jgi:heme/copper-type cytochrome/quinol oxidase subunit 1